MVWDRKEYDRKHQQEIYEQYKQDRLQLLETLGNCCAICRSDTNHLHLHHKYYDNDSNYPRTGNGWSRVKRVKEAMKNPDKFLLLCAKCHIHIDWYMANKQNLLYLSP
jgi:hypothetical protein